MKNNRLKILLILLALSIIVGIISLVKQHYDYYHSDIVIMSIDDYEFEDDEYYEDEEMYGYTESRPYTLYDTQIQNIMLESINASSYALSFEERVSIDRVTNKYMYSDSAIGEELKSSGDFYIVDTFAEKNKIIRKLVNVEDSNLTYDLQIAEYWILNGQNPKAKIASLITPADETIKNFNACEIQDNGSYNDNPQSRTYGIYFNLEKIPFNLLKNYSRKSVSNLCGEYGRVLDIEKDLQSEKVFYYENDVLISTEFGYSSPIDYSTKVRKN